MKSPHFPYVAPMVLLLAFLPLRGQIGPLEYPLQVLVLSAFLWWASRDVISFKTTHLWASIAIGAATFFLWIAPDLLVPGWRAHWLFSNAYVGQPGSTVAPEWRGDYLVLISRTLKATVLVAIIEELFWRNWMMRWLIKPDFLSVPLGTYGAQAFWIVAAMFAIEHGSYWEVGLATGIIWNAWMNKTKSMGDLIVVHGVTNFMLSLYTIFWGQWQYWS
ncbi:MAG: CAAX prenyl protease-related protein [Acidobacteria bacterium]|nr:CAAX prenyl protease-related protein [Acidobacteriota bacterium]